MQLSIKTTIVTLLVSLAPHLLIHAQEANSDGQPRSDSNDNALARPERITVLAPRQLRPRSDYHVLINLANSEVPVNVNVQLTGARDSNREKTETKSVQVNSGESITVKFSPGEWPAAEYVLSVNATAADQSWNFSQEKTLSFEPKSYSGFIQTDKAIYKPGQLVQFRAIFLTRALEPLALPAGEINVSISDPNKNLIKQWTGLANYRGLVSLELQLAQEPPLGEWTIKVEAQNQAFSKQFQVAEYILPTYEVDIHLPAYATMKESAIVAGVKARYTYGKPVRGHVTLTVQPLVRFSSLDTRPLEQVQYKARLENGTADINVDVVRDLRLRPDIFEREIEFFALVEEDLTGRKYNKTSLIKLHERPIKVEHAYSARQQLLFKPGLSKTIRLKVAYQDDTPVENNGPEMVVSYKFMPPGEAPERRVSVWPVNGVAEFAIEVPREVQQATGSAQDRIPGETTDGKQAPQMIELEASYRGQTYRLSPLHALKTMSGHFIQISLPQLEPAGGPPHDRRPGRAPQVNVGDQLKVHVRATEPLDQVTCQGIARGDIVWALSRDVKGEREFKFDVKLDQRMAPETGLLCFYVRPENKELILDTQKLSVQGLERNAVKVSLSRDEAKPGQEVEVGVFTKPNSLVGLLAVDQSVLLLKSGNDITNKDISEEMRSYGGAAGRAGSGPAEDGIYSPFGRSMSSSELIDDADMIVITNNQVNSNVWDEIYRPVSLRGQGNTIRLQTAALTAALPPAQYRVSSKEQSEPQNLVIRSFFPETWIWANSTASSDGLARFSAKAPDTITSWTLSAFSLNENHGFGVSSQRSQLRVFRPFFIKLNLPYSIIRGETVNIQAVIFNYAKKPTSARVVLENRNAEFEFVESTNELDTGDASATPNAHAGQRSQSRLISIPAQDGTSVSFLIRPHRVGRIEIRMLAQAEFAGDGVVEKLLVKPEGQTQHFNKAWLVSFPTEDGSSVVKKNITLEVPSNAVPDSQRVSVSVVGDIMGAGLSNVDDLLRMPYGCGEQNMINLVPNIVILKYLQNTRRVKQQQSARAISNIESGYQRELTFKRRDGSFSAFGESDTNGSVWLTAYVLKSLQQAKSFIRVDERVVRAAANFIGQHARQDGSIEEAGMLHHKELSSLNSAGGSSVYLTAYAMIALLQRPISQAAEPEPTTAASYGPSVVALDEVLEKGLNYLESQLDGLASDEPHNLAIIAYAMQLANRQQSSERAFDKLWSLAHDDRDFIWWEPANKSRSANLTSDSEALPVPSSHREIEGSTIAPSDAETTSSQQPPLKPVPVNKVQSSHLHVPNSLAVETTSLALLTLTKKGALNRAPPIVKWLISQQNSQGGFASTQDTVLAIEALAAYAEASLKPGAAHSISIEVVHPRTQPTASSDAFVLRRNNVDELLVSQSNALVQQKLNLPDNVTWVQLTATGSGSCVLQVSWQYNLLVSAEQPAFYLNPILDHTSNVNYLQLSICTFYRGPGEFSNMALLEVELPSGYTADVEALPSLLRNPLIKKIDTAEAQTKVHVYIERVTADELCLTVPAHRTAKVSNNRPVPVTIYDYYDRQKAARIFYEPQQSSSCEICDPDSCSARCSDTANKRSSKLLSLHEQRRNQQMATGRSADIRAPPSVSNATSAGNSLTNGSSILPLAPVVGSIVAFFKNLR